MSIIHLLPDSISNKIAAGEVVERPASVVKELVENALDAQAAKIIVRIERAGQRLISVSDDGCGMDADDAMLCFEPHATSKIREEEDIRAIHSFGFRGEAMPSIASVSRVTLKTRKRDSAEGFQVSINGGNMTESRPAGCAPGTETCVRDLFYNVPARKKFLKSNATEERHIIDTVSVISLAHPDISFELEIDGRNIIRCPAGAGLRPRIADVFGRDTADAMTDLDYELEGIRITGCITKRGITKPTRQDQRTFVNGRPVESPTIYRGIREGCGPMLEKGRFHPCCLFIEMDPSLVDVNVHPAKREVRFRNEYLLTTAIRNAVSAAMRNAAEQDSPFLAEEAPEQIASFDAKGFIDKIAKTLPQPEPESGEPAAPELNINSILLAAKRDYRPVERVAADAVPASDLFAETEKDSVPAEDFKLQRETEPQQPQHLTKQFPSVAGLQLLGVFSGTYIIAAAADGLLLIDQHAAHERILYEKILDGVDGTVSQRLLIPITVELSRSDRVFLEKAGPLFEQIGFEVEPFGGNSVKLNAIPAAMPQENSGGIFKDILARLSDEGAFSGRTDLAVIARAACKAAVKAHDDLTMDECKALLEQMAKCKLPFCCPHGRPTIINLSIREIERRFGRIR